MAWIGLRGKRREFFEDTRSILYSRIQINSFKQYRQKWVPCQYARICGQHFIDENQLQKKTDSAKIISQKWS